MEKLSIGEYAIPEGIEAVIENGKIILREKESEDERMWNKILNHFDWSFKGPYLTHEECDEIKAFLEKKKDKKPVSVVRAPKFKVGDIIYHVPLEKYDRGARVRAIDENGYSIDFTHIGDTVSGGYIGFSFENEYELVEKGPAEWNNVIGINGEPISTEEQSVDISLTNWSEEDETRLKVIGEELERYIMFKQYGTPLSVDDLDWLKNLPKRFNLTPEQEWSEEDKKILKVISYKISQHQGNDERSLFTPDEAEFMDRMEDKIKSLCYSWKPSEEQLVALWNTLHPDDPYYVDLSSLYDDLKKLLR